MMRSKRRYWMRLHLVVAVSLCLLFALPVAAKEIVIQMWDGLTGADKPVMDEYVEGFNREFAGRIKVERTPIAWPEFYTKLRVSVVGDVAPDLGIMHRNRMPEHAAAHLLRPIDHLFSQFGWADSDWLPGVADGGKYGGKRYGIPLDIHCYLLMYNEDLIATAGLSGPPQNSAQFLDFAKKLTKPGAGPNGTTRFATGFELNATTLATVLWQWGGEYFGGPKQDQVTIDQPASQRALEYLYGLHYQSQVAALPGQPQDIFKGEVAMRLQYTAAINRATQERNAGGISLRVARGDVIYGDQGTGIFANSHMFHFPLRQTDGEREMAAMTFVDYCARNWVPWSALGHLPPRRAAVASAEFRKMREHVAYSVMDFRFFVLQPWGAKTGILDRVMRTVLRNEVPIGNALAIAQQEMETMVTNLKADFNLQ